jgi:hypothetical protein
LICSLTMLYKMLVLFILTMFSDVVCIISSDIVCIISLLNFYCIPSLSFGFDAAEF